MYKRRGRQETDWEQQVDRADKAIMILWRAIGWTVTERWQLPAVKLGEAWLKNSWTQVRPIIIITSSAAGRGKAWVTFLGCRPLVYANYHFIFAFSDDVNLVHADVSLSSLKWLGWGSAQPSLTLWFSTSESFSSLGRWQAPATGWGV